MLIKVNSIVNKSKFYYPIYWGGVGWGGGDGGGDGDDGRIPGQGQPPKTSRPGIEYPVRETPHFDIIIRILRDSFFFNVFGRF